MQVSREATLCAFDFDGTLSPIVEHPDRAIMRVRTQRLLGQLAALYPCVVISGRSRADLMRKLGGAKVARAIGNHGAETESAARSSLRLVKRWKASLEADLRLFPELRIEDKGLSLSVHYRQSPNKSAARGLILAAAQKLPRVHVFGGKQVVNLVVDKAPNKGDALDAERLRLGCDWVLYVGDDDTDEDAFALSGNVIPIRVGRRQRSRARYYLRTQPEIDDLLELLVYLRTPIAPA